MYSAFNALDFAVTVCFSIENAISAKELAAESPKASAVAVAIAGSAVYAPAGPSLRTAGFVSPADDVPAEPGMLLRLSPPENAESASL